MKKYILTCLILCSYTLCSVAQTDDEYIPFLQEGVAKKWTTIGLAYTNPITVYQCAAETDTIINGLAYRTLTAVFEPDLFMAVREENKKVYVFIDYYNSSPTQPFGSCRYDIEQHHAEVLIYDFGLKVGDEFELDSCEIMGYNNTDSKYKVIEQEKVLVQGIVRNKWILEVLSFTNNEWSRVGFHEEWIEGIGSANGFFPDVIQRLFPNDIPTLPPYLACVQENRQVVYDSTYYYEYDCLRGEHEQPPEVTNIATPPQTNTFMFQAFPNIFTQTTTLQFVLPEISMTSLHIYNSQGRKIQTIFSNQILPSGQYQEIVQLENMPNGIYYAVLSLSGTTVAMHKLMKIN